ncbi:Katanin p60 ATPase-containing subunit A-like 2 [Parelaphostrongylus tenuis]|uniref:Katanin p60 ATPase-containing subunit A-like 2 n=1 Tax=Parelaphostrongylus tenuis TaxID=148309 RepID=A0AAD5N2Y1_PARTN|nr:Katanin p60 ATPase-containing subunit A-like 2 [Parelaphostrongylus tenuis]
MFSTHISVYNYDEAIDWLRRFSLLLGRTASRGKYVSREEISRLILSLDCFTESLQQRGILQSQISSLKMARELLDASLRHGKATSFVALPYEEDITIHNCPLTNELLSSHSNLTIDDDDDREVTYSIGSREPKLDESLDSFSNSRRQVIESTIVRRVDEFPTFSDIVGIEEAKRALVEALVDPIQYPDWFKNSDLKPWKTVLLYGPPGTGKSVLSQAVAREINSLLYRVSSSDLISTWSGQSERLIRELFDHATTQKRTAIIFIDEVDSLCRTRCASEDDANRRVKTELLVQIQRLQVTSNVVLVCATNCPWDLDPAFLRRFEKKIYVGLPDRGSRVAMLRRRLQTTTLDESVSMEWIAEATNGFSGDDIRRFATELAYTQFRYFKENQRCNFESDARRPLSRQDVESVLASFSKSVDNQQLDRFEQYRNI